MFYLHGVRWNLTGQLNRISQLRRFGFSVFAIDYRGFGKSDGEMPSEASVYEDARVGWQWLIEHEPDPSRRYIYGHSLGGAVAIDLAAQVSGGPVGARGLIVESSFTSLPELVSEMGYGWVPVSQKFDFDHQDRAGARCRCWWCTAPTIGTCRRALSEALYAAAPQPKKLLLIPNGTHNNSAWTGDADYRAALRELFGPIAVIGDRFPGTAQVAPALPERSPSTKGRAGAFWNVEPWPQGTDCGDTISSGEGRACPNAGFPRRLRTRLGSDGSNS